MLIKNKFSIIFFLSLFILLLLLFYQSYVFIHNRNSILEQEKEALQFCSNITYQNTEYQNYCELVFDNKNVKLDFFTMFTEVVVYGFNLISFALYLFIIMPSLLYISSYFKNKTIINDLTRMNYKQIKIKIFKKSYQSALILPIVITVAFIICFLFTKTFDPTYAVKSASTGWSEYTLNHPILFLIMYLLNIIIHSILYINISLCVVRKYHNYFVAVILSFLTFIGIEAFLEIVLNGIIFTTILKSNYGIIFNIMNMISFNESCGIIISMLVPFIIAIISFLILNVLYKEKEKLIIDCEKNE